MTAAEEWFKPDGAKLSEGSWRHRAFYLTRPLRRSSALLLFAPISGAIYPAERLGRLRWRGYFLFRRRRFFLAALVDCSVAPVAEA